MSPLGSDDLAVGEGTVEGSPVLSRAQRRRQASSGEGVSPKEGEGYSPVAPSRVEDESSPRGVSPRGAGMDEDDDDFDIMSLPAPLADPEAYGKEFIGVEDTPADTPSVPLVADEEDSSEADGVESGVSPELTVGWDIVFPEGENPRMVVRAALFTDAGEDSDEGSVPVVESSVELSDEDVDRLVKLTLRVEKHHSRSSKLGRRVFGWIMRRKFFAGATFVILMYLGISEVVRAFT